MRNKAKRIFGLAMATAVIGTAFSLTGCKGGSYTGTKLEDYVSTETAAVSNGGFAVEKDNFVYFINASESYTASNKYGSVEKGALMRIARADLDAGNYANVQTVVPMLFVAQNYDAGIYIYGDYVYFATPTRDKNLKGDVENTWLDFKCAKLDGSEAMKDYYFRLESNSSKYRFVEAGEGENKAVYCLYEEEGALKSYNTATDTHTVLVSGAKSTFFYNESDPTDSNVYYTMSVVEEADSANPQTLNYDQLYCVNAAATATVSASEAKYTVTGGKTYDFDETYLEKSYDGYSASDYTTYPYVNLGTLVLDGVGSSSNLTQYNNESEKDTLRVEPDGYTYSLQRFANDGVYFTRTEVVKTSSEAESSQLYYLPHVRTEWNTVSGNTALDVVAQDTTKASSSAIFTVAVKDNVREHAYLYLDGETLYKAVPNANGVATPIAMAHDLTDATLFKIEGDYLYYYTASTNGNGLSRINYTGTKEHYNVLDPLRVKEEYQPVTVDFVDWNSAWYKPEMIGNTVLYSNAQSYGDGATAYNYVYAAKLGTTQEIIARNEAYQSVQDYIDEYDENSALQDAMEYYFRTGTRDKFDAVKSLYSEYQVEEFEAFVAKFAENGEFAGKFESNFLALVGKMKASDAEEISSSWTTLLLEEEVVETAKDGMPSWAIALIVIGCVLVVGVAVAIPTIIVCKKKRERKKEAEATVNAYKRKKIDTTDDKSIDVYATDEAEETPAETQAEAIVEEAPNAAETVAETTEEVVEEASAAEEKTE